MTYADFEYYSGTYMGAVSENDFPRLVVRASSFLDYYTRNRAQNHADLKKKARTGFAGKDVLLRAR